MSDLYFSTNAHDKSLQSITGTSCDRLLCDFVAGTVKNSTQAIIVDKVVNGNHYAYKVTDHIKEPMKGDKIIGSIPYVSGNNIYGIHEGKCILIYELDIENKVEKFIGHTPISSEIKCN